MDIKLEKKPWYIRYICNISFFLYCSVLQFVCLYLSVFAEFRYKQAFMEE